jgi:hypothetical protein
LAVLATPSTAKKEWEGKKEKGRGREKGKGEGKGRECGWLSVVDHPYNSQHRRLRQDDNSRPAWATQRVQGHSSIHSKSLSQKTKGWRYQTKNKKEPEGVFF